MTEPIIQVDGISKAYRIGLAREQHATLRDALMRTLTAPLRRFSKLREQTEGDDVFWALSNVSFDIQPGEVVGIIGRNGAGKSTLLKVLSRITEPTEGEARINGRVASLLEVGTGFHPELTGRENIYLNGAILGMSRQEIKRKFDQIVAFSEVEKFLDTPVKRYSSGMYVRLAFAVAAHLEPEVLIVDEVLAVGDVQFQKKCLGKMREVAEGDDRTVLFVSHSMASVESLCDRAVWLHHGQIQEIGPTSDVVRGYMHLARTLATDVPLANRIDRLGDGRVRVSNLCIADDRGVVVPAARSGADYVLRLQMTNTTDGPIDDVRVQLRLFDEEGASILLVRSSFSGNYLTLPPGESIVHVAMRRLPLAASEYSVALFVTQADAMTLDCVEEAAIINVESGDYFGTGATGYPNECKTLYETDWWVEQPETALGTVMTRGRA